MAVKNSLVKPGEKKSPVHSSASKQKLSESN